MYFFQKKKKGAFLKRKECYQKEKRKEGLQK